MFCNKCGVDIPEGSTFCNKCGASQGGVTPAAAAITGGAAKNAELPPAKEEDAWKGGYSMRAMGMAFVGSGAWFVGLWIAYFLLTAKGSSFEGKTWVVWLFAILSPIPAIYAFSVALWRKMTLRYRLTTQRLFREVGLIGRHIEEMELIRVDDVATEQGIIERIFDVGSIIIRSSDQSTPLLRLVGLRTPVALKEKIRTLVQERRKRIVNLQNV